MAARDSSARASSPLNSAICKRTCGQARASASNVPPQPISTSSQCAPSTSTSRKSPDRGRVSMSAAAPTSFEHLDARDGYHEFSAPLAHVSALLRDLRQQIPGKNQDVVRLRFPNALRRQDRNARSGCEAPLLVRTAVHRVVQKIRADAAIVEQCIPLAGRAVPDNRLALLLRVDQKAQ